MIALRPLPGYFAALLAAGAVTLVSSYARAACTTNADCSHGFECQVVGGSGCAGVACPDGQTCPPQPPCDPVEIKDCVPGGCNVDADCADGMVCFASERTDCPVTTEPACPPNTVCEVPPPDMGTCTITTIKMCVPRYLLPCTAASDCGTGFDCALDPPACWCNASGGSGSGGSGGSEPAPAPGPVPTSGGTEPVPPPASTAPSPAPTGSGSPDCGCTPSTTNHCKPQVVTCTANSQCPTGWTCQPVGSGDRTCSASILPDGGVESMCEPAPPPTMQCMPPYADVIGGYYANDSGSLNASLPPQGQIGGAPTGAPSPEASGTPKAGAPSASSGDTGGCQVGHGSTNAGASLLALAGLIGLSRRRSRRLA